MISLQFNLRNPFSNRWKFIKLWSGKTPFKNKFWEVQIDKTSDIIGFDLRLTFRQDHAGLFVSFALFGYDIIFNFYDSRHWDDEENCWYKRDGEENLL